MTPHNWKISSRTVFEQLNQTLQYSRQYFKGKKHYKNMNLVCRTISNHFFMWNKCMTPVHKLNMAQEKLPNIIMLCSL